MKQYTKKPMSNADLADRLIDRKLRQLASDALARIEVAVRTMVVKQPNLNRYTSVFAILSICAHCIQYVHPQSKWRERCRALLESADQFVLTGMGVPSDWQTLALWK